MEEEIEEDFRKCYSNLMPIINAKFEMLNLRTFAAKCCANLYLPCRSINAFRPVTAICEYGPQ